MLQNCCIDQEHRLCVILQMKCPDCKAANQDASSSRLEMTFVDGNGVLTF